MGMKEFNGHRSWNAWNVSLWINNDENLYNFALECINNPVIRGDISISIVKPTLNVAVRRFMRECDGLKTPDGAVYNRLSVKLALQSLMEK